MKLSPEGNIFVYPLLIITGLLFWFWSIDQISIYLPACIGIILLFCLNFFRDPLRSIPSDKSVVVAPADGKVVKIEYIDDPNVGESAKLVSIFLNVFNVHVNRVPIDGLVVSVDRKKGKFLAAFNHIASD